MDNTLPRKIMVRVVLAFLIFGGPAFAQEVSPQIQILALTCTNTSAGPEVEGEIKNISGQALGNILMVTVFKAADGSFVSTSDSGAKFNPILPGQTSPFDGYGDTNPSIATVEATPAMAGGGSVPASGGDTAPCS